MDFWLNEESLGITGEDLTPRLSAEFGCKPPPLVPGVSDELTALLTALPAHSRSDVVRNGTAEKVRARKRSDNDSSYASDPTFKEEEGKLSGDYVQQRDAISVSADSSDEKSPSSTMTCDICGDGASGRHYGAIACNGCKGFFRRTIRRGHKYECRFSKNCAIDKHTRAVCRYCRYARCLSAGMKVEAVQNERDAIGKRPRGQGSEPQANSSPYVPESKVPRADSSQDGWDTPKLLLESLIRSESLVNQLRDTVIKQADSVEYATRPIPKIPSTPDGQRNATVNDVGTSIHSQLLLVVEWAKTLPAFAVLPMDDQMALLKSFAAKHVVLGVAYRSIGEGDRLKLTNNAWIPRQYNNETDFPCRDCDKILDELVAPMRFMKIDEVEFVAMKACVLFNPVAKGLSRESVMPVLQIRRKIFAALEHYVNSRIPSDPGRLGDLTFFILSPLQATANSFSEDLLIAKLSGVARIDVLMEELILTDDDDRKYTEAISPKRTPLAQNGADNTSYYSSPSIATSPYQLSNSPSLSSSHSFPPAQDSLSTTLMEMNAAQVPSEDSLSYGLISAATLDF